MKQGWTTKSLAAVCEIRPPKSEASKKVKPTELVSFLPMENLGIGIKFVKAKQSRPLSELIGSYTYFADGDVLLAKITPCFENGKLGIANDLENGIGFGSSEYIVFRPQKQLDPEWLYYFLSQESFRMNGAARMTGAVGHKRVSKEFIEESEIPVPPMEEQRRIVALLDEAFAGIAVAKANAEQNLKNVRELFESYLNAIFTNHGPDWRQRRLGEVCELFQGLCINAKTKHLLVEKSSLPLLRIKDLRNDTVEQYIAETGWPKNARVDAEEIIYTRTGQIGLVFRGRTGVLHNNCFKVSPSPEINSDFLFWWLQSPKFRNAITKLAGKAAQPDISHALFKDQIMFVPPLTYQVNQIATINEMLSSTESLVTIYERKLAALEELKKTLLDKAFAGEL